MICISMKTIQIINPESFMWLYADTMDVLYTYYCPDGTTCTDVNPQYLDKLIDRKCNFNKAVTYGKDKNSCNNGICEYSGASCSSNSDCCNTSPARFTPSL